MQYAVTLFLAGAVTFTFAGGCMHLGLPERWCIAVATVTWAVALLVISTIWLDAHPRRR